jgi:outer membrane receptor protein involved in Fe transport
MNVGNGWTRGLEFEQRLRMPSAAPRWARLFSFWANQTLLSSNLRAFNGQQRPLKEQPRWIANLGSDFSDEKFGSTLSVMCNFVSRRYDYKTNGDVTSLGGSTSLDIAYYQRLHGNWRIFLEGNNLTGRGRVQDEIFLNGTLNRRTELFGRTMLFGIQVGF